MARFYQDPEWLQDRLDEGLTNAQMAARANCGEQIITRLLDRFKLERDTFKYRDRDWLNDQYETKPTSEIAKECGVVESTILRWLHKFDIPIKSHSHWWKGPHQSEEWLRQKYWVEGLTLEQMGQEASVHTMIIHKWMRRLGVPIKSRGDRMRERWLAGKPTCVNPGEPTSLENRMAGALMALGIDFTPQFSPFGIESVYDFFVMPDKLIEVDGLAWHSKPKDVARDKRKSDWAKSNGYRLLIICEDEMTGIEWIERLYTWLV